MGYVNSLEGRGHISITPIRHGHRLGGAVVPRNPFYASTESGPHPAMRFIIVVSHPLKIAESQGKTGQGKEGCLLERDLVERGALLALKAANLCKFVFKKKWY